MDQQQNDNVEWLSLLPLFGTDHWPVNARSRVPHLPDLDEQDAEWLCECICDVYEHNIVCVFPYAAMGTRDAWCIFEDTLRLVEDESARQRITDSWPFLWVSIFHQYWDHNHLMYCRDENPCESAGYNFPYWDTENVTYERCDCPYYDDDELDSYEAREYSEEEEDEYDFLPLNLDDFMDFDPDDEYVRLGRFGTWIDGRPQKGYSVGSWFEWNFELTGESSEIDEPPAYEDVSELPSYEMSQSLMWRLFHA